MERILIHTHSARAVTSSMIGHIYELAQVFPVAVLTEPLPDRYNALLADRTLFPGVERVHTARTLGFSAGDLVRRNTDWWKLAATTLDDFRPDLVIAENDMSSLFDMYLLRQARVRGIRRLTIQSMGHLLDRAVRIANTAEHIYRRVDDPTALQRTWQRAVTPARKRAGHALVHYALPWSIGQPALRGGSSYIHVKGATGMRDTELHLVQSVSQYRTFRDCGVAPEKLAILPHPVTRIPSQVFFPSRSGAERAPGTGLYALVLLPFVPVGVDRQTGRVIGRAERRASRIEAIEAIVSALSGMRTVIKAHPDYKTAASVADYLGSLRDRVEIVDPSEPIEPWLADCSAVIDLPSPTTTVLMTAAAALPDVPIIAADLDADVIGGHYDDWPGIEYVASTAALTKVLASLRAGTYRRSSSVLPVPHGCPVFRDTVEAARHALAS